MLFSAVLRDLLEDLTTLERKGFLKQSENNHKLKDLLRIFSDVIDHAEEKQFTDVGNKVKDWLNHLQLATYDLEECLGRIITKSSARQLGLKHAIMQRFSSSKKGSLREILESLENLASQKDVLGLRKDDKEYAQEMLPGYYTSNSEAACFYGREDEEKWMSKVLLSGDDVKLISIIGEAGVGKTAFTEYIYFSGAVTKSFELRAWVTVPYGASVCSVGKKILQAVTQEISDPRVDFRQLQDKLKDCLAGKKFLLVLDNNWIKDSSDKWNNLITSLEVGAKGSAVIMTARPVQDDTVSDSEKFVPIPRTSYILPLGLLPAKECWSIFSKPAALFAPDAFQVRVEIFNKLGNLPLAAKLVRSLLEDNNSEGYIKIQRSNLLNVRFQLNLRIPLFLVLCYLHLPADVGRCLAYLSIFPKGHELKQKEVVLWWMAQGFLRSNGKSMEQVGNEYFSYLLRRQFIQPLAGGDSFLMHNLIHDLASFAFGEYSKHHLLYVGGIQDHDVHLLKTILPLERETRRLSIPLLKETISQLNPQMLRILSFSDYDISELPSSIGRLTSLCYLDLSRTTLQALPSSIGDLYHLQTLLLTDCRLLKRLPKKINKLTNLRYLDVRGTNMKDMPSQISRLKDLRILIDFVVSRRSSRLEELKSLNNLETLAISELQNVSNPIEASSAKLEEKKCLGDLTFRWSSNGNHLENGSEILENLEPASSITRLNIEYYGGYKFPSWLGNVSFINLQSIKLRHCRYCTLLPPLGKLPYLKDLLIEGFNQVKSVGSEFYEITNKAFQSLESLRFEKMSEWAEWNIPESIKFPCLLELSIIECPKFAQGLPKQLPSLVKLEISQCPDLVAPHPKMPDTCEVFVNNINGTSKRSMLKIPSRTFYRREVSHSTERQEVSPNSLPVIGSTYIEASTVTSVDDDTRTSSKTRPESLDVLNSPRKQSTSSAYPQVEVEDCGPSVYESEDEDSMAEAAGISERREYADTETSSFEMLTVSNVSELKKLPRKLQSLKIEGCDFLGGQLDNLAHSFPDLQELYMVDCDSLETLSHGSFTTCLKTFYVRNCCSLKFPGPSESMLMFESLEHLSIENSCYALESFSLDVFPKLETLSMWDCPNLKNIVITRKLALKSLSLVSCMKLEKLPDFKDSLHSLVLKKCPEIIPFSTENLRSSLTVLSIAFCDKLMPQERWGLHNLESLSHFEIEGGCGKMESFSENLLPTNIKSLRISNLEHLRSLDFKQPKTLQTLEINCCKNLYSLPESGLSLSFLCIKECPLLTRKLLSRAGKDWNKIAYIPHIQIDDEVIS